MPLHCWLLLSALLWAMPVYANQTAAGWQSGIAITVLLLLTVLLTLYNSKLRRRHTDMLDKHSVLQGFLQQSDDLVAILTEDFRAGYLNPALTLCYRTNHDQPGRHCRFTKVIMATSCCCKTSASTKIGPAKPGSIPVHTVPDLRCRCPSPPQHSRRPVIC